MWEAITTFSEIDTVKTGTFLARENPQENTDVEIYRVTGRTEDNISISSGTGTNTDESFVIKWDALFDEGWWMLKEDKV